MNQFIRAAIERYRAVIMLFTMLIIFGISAYITIPKEREPDVQIPIVVVHMKLEGISPEDGKDLLLKPMENALKSVEQLKEMTSYAAEGRASVILEFRPGFDSDQALLDVRERVDEAKSELPQEAEEPEVEEINLSLFPVLNVVISGDLPLRSLITIAREMRDEIESHSNVLEVRIGGDLEEVVDIIITPETLQSLGVSLADLSRSVSGFNSLVAAGNLESDNGNYRVKVPGLLQNINDISALPVIATADTVITLGDITTIRKGFKQATSSAKVQGKSSVVLEVSKRTGTNMIQTIADVKAMVEEKRHFLPKNLTLSFASDRSETIFAMLQDLQNNIILAVLLVLGISIFFVGWRMAALIAIAIPGAFLIGILLLNTMGLTVNIVVLFSLILSVGMLVDAAIVVCELADRYMREGKSRFDAYAEATYYMKWPIIVSTITTLCAFMPLLFWPGTIGQFMKYMPITLIATLSASLFMALIFIPTFGALWGGATTENQGHHNIHAAETGNYTALTGTTARYFSAISWVLEHPKKMLLTLFITLTAIIAIYVLFFAKTEFFPSIEPENAIVQVRARGNLSLVEKAKIMAEVEAQIIHLKDEIRMFYTKSGQVAQAGNSYPEDTIGLIQIEFSPWQERRKADEIMEEIRQKTSSIAGIIVSVVQEKAGPQSQKPIDIELSSHLWEPLQESTLRVKNALKKINGVISIEDTLPVPQIEWNIEIDRPLTAQFGADVSLIGSYVKLVTSGLKVSSYRPLGDTEEVDIVLRFPPAARGIDQLDALTITTTAGSVPVSNFVTRTAKHKITTINRTSSRRTLGITADLEPGILASDVVSQLQNEMKKTTIPENVFLKFKGDDEDKKESMVFLLQAFLIAIFTMALILVIQFNSLYYAAIILSAVFLSIAGVLLGLMITGRPFGIVMCGVGIVSLSGIVVNNNIILIDSYLKLRRAGEEAYEAVLKAAISRLRPILLTSVTTILGLMPMVIGMTIDFLDVSIAFGAPSSQWWKQLATSIAGGLFFATFLTLFITPALLIVGENYIYKKRVKLHA